jgi:hypothetical protein
MTVGFAVTGVAALSCGKYEVPEERGPCMAGAITGGAMWVLLGTLIGRQIDRALGNEPLYRRPRTRPQVVLSPALSPTGFGLLVSVPY